MWETKKWLSVSIYVSTFITYGAVYSFTLLYPLIKHQLNFSQKDIDFAGTSFYAGSNLFGYFLAPPLANALPVPTAVAIGGFLQPLCQACIGLTAVGALRTPWYIFSLFYLVLGFSNGVVFNLVTQQIINALPSNQSSLAVAVPSCCHAFGGLTFSILISLIPINYFFILLVSLQTIFTSLTVWSISQNRTPEAKPLLESADTDLRQYSSMEVMGQLFRTTRFYLCVISTGIMVGCGTTLMTNVGIMAQSLHLLVSQGAIVTQFAQFVGRASTTLLYYFHSWPTDTIDVAILLTLFYACIFFTMASSDQISNLQFTIFNLVFGAAYGCGWTIIGNFTRFTARPEKQYWTDVCAVIYPSTAFGTFLFNYIVGTNYDSHVLNGEVECFGIKCYETAFWVVGSFAIVSVFCLILLRQKTHQLLKQP